MQGYYLFCVVNSLDKNQFQEIGMESRKISFFPYQSLTIVGQKMEISETELDQDTMLVWAKNHHSVIERAQQHYTNVLPFSFMTIIKGTEIGLNQWLKKHHFQLTQNFTKIKNRLEYGIQIAVQTKTIIETTLSSSNELKDLKNKAKSHLKGLAYIYQKQYEEKLEQSIHKYKRKLFRNYMLPIKKIVSDVCIEDPKPVSNDYTMFLNLSILACNRQVEEIGGILDNIHNKGFKVTFTGPLPPYSFAEKF
jgi:hypothetical protein